jgi:hypothetical protein
MRKLTFRSIVALFSFIIGVAATTIWLIYFPTRTTVLPAGEWEARFFQTINQRTAAANLPSLRTLNLPRGDLEVRLWVSFSGMGADGIMLRRSANNWSALFLHGLFEDPSKESQRMRNLAEPKSGWDKMWQRLVANGILTLPDAAAIDCKVGALDGSTYVVEVNTNKTYRTYLYDTPQFAKCSEAKRVVEIIEILLEEFGIYQQPE